MKDALYWFNELKDCYPAVKEDWIEEGYDEIPDEVFDRTEKLVKVFNEFLEDMNYSFGYYVGSIDLSIREPVNILINIEDSYIASIHKSGNMKTDDPEELLEFLKKGVEENESTESND